MSNSLLHLVLEQREQRIILVLHQTASNTAEGSLESRFLDSILSGGILNCGLHLFEGAKGNFSQMVSKVLALEVLNHFKHVVCSSVEVLFKVQLLVSQVVNECSLLDEIVLSIDAYVFHLLLGVSEMSELFLLSDVCPHATKLLCLITSVHIVEHCELGTNEVSEVTDFDVTEVECDQILVMEDHTTDPLVVGPSTES